MATKEEAIKAKNEVVKHYRDLIDSAGISTKSPNEGWYVSVTVIQRDMVDKIPRHVKNVEVQAIYAGPVRAYSE